MQDDVNMLQLLPIMFIYGLSFFSMGLVTALEARRSPVLVLARYLPFLSIYGILFGTVEWLQLFLLSTQNLLSPVGSSFVELSILLLLAGSTTSLIFFGSSLIARFRSAFRWLSWAAPAMLIAWLAGEMYLSLIYPILSTDWFIQSSMMIRYILYIPGCVLAVIALFLQSEELESFESPSLVTDCVWAGVAFAMNTLIVALVVSENGSLGGSILSYLTFVEPTNVYVQVLRTMAAIVIAVFVVRVLRVHEIENRRQLERADAERFAAQQEAIDLQREARERILEWNRELEKKIADRTKELERTNRELYAMNTVAGTVSRSLDLDQILSDSLREIVEAGRLEAGAIFLQDQASGRLKLKAHIGLSRERADLLSSRMIGPCESFLGQVFADGRPRIAEDAGTAAWFEHIPGASEQPFQSVVGAPLQVQNRVLGVMKLATRSRVRLKSRNMEMLLAMAQQLSVAVDNALLFQETELRQREAEALLKVSSEISAFARIDTVLQLIAEKASGLVNSDAAAIGLVDSRARETFVKATHGLWSDFLRNLRQQNGQGLLGAALNANELVSGEQYSSIDNTTDLGTIDQAIVESGVRAHVIVPLHIAGELAGVLIIGRRSRQLFSEEDCSLLRRLANQAAIALHNARLFDEVQRLAIHEERYRIAREMHDGLAQVLGYFNIQTKNLEYLVRSGESDEVMQSLQEMNRLAIDAYADVREAILGLRTSVSPDQRTVSALREYIEKYSRLTKLSVYFDCEVEELGLAPNAEAQLMRIVQEALTNVRKHAKATAVWVRIERKPRGVRTMIEDNGIGFEEGFVPDDGRDHFGLKSMRERAALVGGLLSFDTAPGKGTRLVFDLPFRVEATGDIGNLQVRRTGLEAVGGV